MFDDVKAIVTAKSESHLNQRESVIVRTNPISDSVIPQKLWLQAADRLKPPDTPSLCD